MQHRVPTIMLDIMEIFRMDAGTASWLMSIFVLVGVLVAIPTGSLAQRFGFKKMILAAIALAVVGSVIGIAAGEMRSTSLLLFSRALEGIALTVITACGPIGVSTCVRPERLGTAMGIWGVWGSLGAVVGAVVAPSVFASLGFVWVWIITAGFAIIAAVLLILLIRDPQDVRKASSGVTPDTPGDTTRDIPGDITHGVQDRVQAPDTEPGAASQDKPRYREIFTRSTVLYLFGFICFGLILLAFLSFMPSILRSKGYDATLAGFITTFPSLLSIISAPVFGILSDRIHRVKPLLVAAFAVFGPAVFVMFMSTGAVLWVAALVLGLIGAGCFGIFLAGWTNVLPRPELIPIAMGVFILAQCIGQFLGTYLIQFFLGPGLDQYIPAAFALLVIGVLGTVSLALARYR
jgi:MFS family permease